MAESVLPQDLEREVPRHHHSSNIFSHLLILFGALIAGLLTILLFHNILPDTAAEILIDRERDSYPSLSRT